MSNKLFEQWTAGDRRKIAFVISGPSGAGKSAVINRVLTEIPDLAYSVSYTTRPCRENEQEGIDYFYISRKEFQRLLAQGDILEHVEYMDALYGTSKSHINRLFAQGVDVILNIDVTGANTLRTNDTLDFPLVYIFLTSPSLDTLRSRLKQRGTEDKEIIERRLAEAVREMEMIHLFDYLLINDSLEQTVAETKAIIIAERRRIRTWRT
jgi:guanylate kinase